ncbi:MAG: hypothetical protein ACRDKB_12525 [Actinomycetota bacterium]
MARMSPRFVVPLALAGLSAMVLPPGAASADPPIVPVSTNLGCDPLDPAICLFPFPNDHFTLADESTGTGLEINLSPLAMPRSGTEVTEGGEGKPIDPTEWNRNDGFSPGSMVTTLVPGLDLHVTWGTQDRPHGEAEPNEPGYFDHRDHIADIGLYAREDAPIVILNAETGERHPFWSELDTHPNAISAGEQALILRPAVNFEEGARYIVALRNLLAADGTIIEAGPDFAAYLDDEGEDSRRQDHYNRDVFPVLERAGIDLADLYLAWDFTVASEDSLAERILHMRDDAFGRILGDPDLADLEVEGNAPGFVIDSVSEFEHTWSDSRGTTHSQPYRRVEGRVTVPNYMDRIQQTEAHFKEPGTAPGTSIQYDVPAPGSRLLDINRDGLPDQNPVESTVNAFFVCEVPLNGQENFPGLYGHGLLGQARDQIQDFRRSPGPQGPFLGCAADWWGMSTQDVPTVLGIIADLSLFPSLADRAQQGFLNFMFLGRALVHPDGLASDPAFQQDDQSLLATDDPEDGAGTRLFYDGNSQGGIMGGSLVAVSPDVSRAILGVPGMTYSTLLNRSVDWEGEFAVPFYEVYRDPLERQLSFALIQMLWDRAEANGYAHHMTDDPLANTPPHEVMLQVAYSDHQVANVAAEVEARTIGAPIMLPGLPDGRHWEMDPYFGPTATYPYDGSALVYWDSGNARPPNGNIPPDHNGDPHSHPRREPAAAWQEAHFLLTGEMFDVCGGGDYLTSRHPDNEDSASCHPPEWPPGQPPLIEGTGLRFTGASASSGQHSDPTIFEAELSDSGGVPIAAAELTFELANEDTSRSFAATTDQDGIAGVTPTLSERPGDYELTVTFSGDDNFAAATADMVFVVHKEDTGMTLTVEGRGSNRTLIARLADDDSDDPVPDRAVDFYGDGEFLGTATTGSDGTARLTAPPRFRGGGHDFEAQFLGDDFYLSSAAQHSTTTGPPGTATSSRALVL